MGQYQVMVTEDGLLSIQGSRGRVLRGHRDDWEHLSSLLTDSHKGIYILYGRGQYYVGQGVFKQRLVSHLTNPDKHFSRMYLLMHKGDYAEELEFSHYLLDIEGCIDRYLSQLNIPRMNKDRTSQIPLLEHHQELVDEWVNLLHIIDPTFRDMYVHTTIEKPTQTSTNNTEFVISEADVFSYEGQDQHDLEDLDPHIQILKAYLNDSSQVNEGQLRSAVFYSGLADINDTGQVTVKPYIDLSVEDNTIYLDDVFNQYTQQEEDTIKELVNKYRHIGYLTKQKGVSIKLYRKLVKAGHFIQDRHNKQGYYIEDRWLDILSQIQTHGDSDYDNNRL